jgi:hypothetical protein
LEKLSIFDESSLDMISLLVVIYLFCILLEH